MPKIDDLWSEKDVVLLRKAHATGMSYSRISRDVFYGRHTLNSIAGKCGRLKDPPLPPRPNPTKPKNPNAPKKPNGNVRLKQSLVPIEAPEAPTRAAPPVTRIPHTPRDRRLGPKCQYPTTVRIAGTERHRFLCTEPPASEGAPYCAEHQARCWQPTRAQIEERRA